MPKFRCTRSLGGATALERDHGEDAAGSPANARHDHGIVAEQTVAVQLDEAVEGALDELEGCGPVGGARHLDDVVGVRAGHAPVASALAAAGGLLAAERVGGVGPRDHPSVQAKQLGEGGREALTLHDEVAEAVLEQELRPLEA